jgi:protease-4
VLTTIKKKLGMEEKDKVSLVELKKYNRSFSKTESFKLKKVAVIYAVGEITSGKGDEDNIGSEKMAETIRKARMDSSIKAIVLRVNSPGGSALASEVIWREMKLARKAKPVVVSMGDVAASGGYYIACAADTIVAQPNTITGSIGVFGLMMNTKKLFNEKLGVTFDTVKTATYSDIGNSTRPMMPAERNVLQNEVERIYATFITHVGEGRHLDTAVVDGMGQGRVWSGTDAKRLKLVDVLGGVNDAVAIAARMAKLDKYRVVALPEQKENVLRQYIEDLSENTQVSMIRKELGESYDYYKQFNRMKNMSGIRAELMYTFDLE